MQVGHKVLATVFLLSACTADGQTDPLQTTDEAEEVQDLPEGMRLAQALNGSQPIRLLADWDLFLGFEDRQKLIRGKLTLTIFFNPEAYSWVSDPQKIVSVDNFADGDRYLQGTVNVVDPQSGRESIATSNIYVGDFSQSMSRFDHSCYPFDEKKVKFEISIQKPGDYIFSLDMLCPEPRLTERIIDPKKGPLVVKCTGKEQGSYVGFDWGSFVCDRIDDQHIMCEIVGVRQWPSVFKGHLWPSFTFSALGFLSFSLSVKMAMPRIATTMLALVSLTSLRNAVMNELPASGSTSWLEEYFLISMTFMLLNLCGHAFSFYLDYKGKVLAQKMVNSINFFGMISIAFFVSVLRLHERDCMLVNRDVSTFMVVAGAVSVIASFATILWVYRSARLEVVGLARDLVGRREKGSEVVV